MTRHLDLGIAGEDLARRVLEQAGYRILERNVRLRSGELDLVALDKDELVVVEVRTRSIGKMAPPETTVGPRKLLKLVRTGRWYVQRSGWEGPWRIDVVAVTVGPGKEPEVEVFRDVTVGLIGL
ncbi:MAG: YraN family protein [Thermovirgaceae bacterium]